MRRTKRTAISCTMTCIGLIGMTLCVSSSFCQEENRSPEFVKNDLIEQQNVEEATSTAQLAAIAERRRKASAGLAAVAAIAILGIGVMAATMIWAKRLRRLARDPGVPQKTAGNDFWFLKPPKSIAKPEEIHDSDQQETNGG